MKIHSSAKKHLVLDFCSMLFARTTLLARFHTAEGNTGSLQWPEHLSLYYRGLEEMFMVKNNKS